MLDVVKKKKAKAPRRHGADIVKEGALQKLGKRVTLWRARYFVIRGGVLEYYLDQLSWLESRAPKGSLPLLGARISKPTESSAGKHHCIALNVTTNPDRTYSLAAESLEEQSDWFEALTQEIDAARRRKQEDFDYQVTKSFRDDPPVDAKPDPQPEVKAAVEKPDRVWLEQSVASSVHLEGRKMASVVGSVYSDSAPFIPGAGRPRMQSESSDVSIGSESSEQDPFSEWDVHNKGKPRAGGIKYRAEKPPETDKEGGICSCALL